MANSLYTKAKQHLIDGTIDLDTNDIRAILVDGADYTPDLATHETLANIPAAARVAVSGALASKTVTDGVFDAADVTLAAVTGDQFEYIVLYQHTGAESALLIALLDTATGLPCTPNGSDITIQWSAGADKIFRLS
ncbi:MAG: hypothetical protein A2Y72_03670 [Chloroflexi bacterium RBG_13_53_26]|nr:MAG: hypothetical protein A2Y72_03670 [Chloroflexi bacterium RBG_13_53_26]